MKQIILASLLVSASFIANAQIPSQLSTAANDHVALRVTDFEQSVKWYTEKLGFKEVTQWNAPAYLDPGLKLAYLRLNDIVIEIAGGGSPERDTLQKKGIIDLFDREGYFHLCIRVANIDLLIKELKQKGIPILAGPNTNTHLNRKFIHVLDNSNNDIEFVEYLK